MRKRKSQLSSKTRKARQMRLMRLNETQEEREARLLKDRLMKSYKRSQETSEERQLRLEKDRIRMASYRKGKLRSKKCKKPDDQWFHGSQIRAYESSLGSLQCLQQHHVSQYGAEDSSFKQRQQYTEHQRFVQFRNECLNSNSINPAKVEEYHECVTEVQPMCTVLIKEEPFLSNSMDNNIEEKEFDKLDKSDPSDFVSVLLDETTVIKEEEDSDNEYNSISSKCEKEINQLEKPDPSDFVSVLLNETSVDNEDKISYQPESTNLSLLGM